MEPKKNNWQIALSNLGAVYFFACLGSNAPFVFNWFFAICICQYASHDEKSLPQNSAGRN